MVKDLDPTGTLRPPPDFIAPQLPSPATTIPQETGWIHEIKFDGYRIMARIEDGAVKMISRNNNNWTRKFKLVATELTRLPITNAMLDGEIVVMREDGTTSFGDLQEALSADQQHRLHYYVFDILFLNGRDLMSLPLMGRKILLKGELNDTPPHIHYSDYLEGAVPDLLAHVRTIGAEGIVSKRMAAHYRSGRHVDWVKVKCKLEQDMIIVGYTGRKKLGSLLVGYYEDGVLRLAGKVGTGFTRQVAQELFRGLTTLQPVPSPFAGQQYKGALWIEPRLVAQIAFQEWTKHGMLRHASYKGLRIDIDPADVKREITTRGLVKATRPQPKKVSSRNKPDNG